MAKKEYQLKVMEAEGQRRQARIEEFLVTGVTSHRAIALALGVDEVTVTSDIKGIMERWVGERPRQNRIKRERLIRGLEMIVRSAYVEFEKSKQSQETLSTTHEPKRCEYCGGSGQVKSRTKVAKCKRCEGKGEVLTEVVTKKVSGQCGDPRYLQVALACQREIGRLQGLGQARRELTKNIKNEQKHLHVHMNQVLSRWENAPPEVLLQAKALVDKIGGSIPQRELEARDE